MRTAFSPEQLADPHLSDAEHQLRTCIHCGFCTATCPTYVLLGDERDSPRGRIWLIKDMLERDQTPTREVVTHIDRCLSCLACTTTCPSGVDYMHLVDHARVHVEETYRRPLGDRMMRWMLAKVLPYPGRFAIALRVGRMASPFAGILARLPGGKGLAAMLRMAKDNRAHAAMPGSYAAAGVRKGRVILQAGCAEPVLRPDYQAATARLLNRLGYDVERAPDEVCCGSLVHHLGREDEALAFVRHNVDAWSEVIDGIDAIVVTVSGCGTTIKDYGFLLRNDPAYAGRAARISALARDITEFLRPEMFGKATGRRLRVAYHAACSLQHGQKITSQPGRLLATAGFEVTTPVDAHLCCGSAGTYNILQPEIAQELGDRKAASLEALKPDVIATGNIGCAVQIGMRTGIPVVHIAELLDWAAGGPKPRAIERSEEAWHAEQHDQAKFR
jgi:glycolate oxidase iron-sulfur subunit